MTGLKPASTINGVKVFRGRSRLMREEREERCLMRSSKGACIERSSGKMPVNAKVER